MDVLSWVYSSMDSSLRLAVPLVFAALGGIYAERSGIVDIGLEGKMLMAAFAAAATSALTGSPMLGLVSAVLSSVLMAMMHGFAVITWRGDQIISGLAINFFASGLTVTIGHALFDMGGQTPTLSNDQRFNALEWPGAQWVAEHVPVLGSFYHDVISGHNVLVYLAFLLVPVAAFVLFKTRFGLRVRAMGEEPKAADTAGISVSKVRYQALIITGVMCGFSGAYLSMAQNAAFVREMTAGQGYIALAAVILGKWRPVGAMLGCLLFGVLSAMETRLQSVELPIIGEMPTQLFSALPYILTVVLLAGFIGRSIAPKAIGQPYIKER
ncbi:ABC transporter permease [uncultured Endozoicomonas sp.]|uniref:ABC transporter permease n=1 Tax=uncultured Endozoicomonas sp. TaxID=432652 RepID=UPI00262E7F0A|nr:ABC transporter permease [uncultured Endozoicomonas sp.]